MEVIILDINCDIYLYNEKNNSENYLFNLHKLSCIDEQIKRKKLFSMGYPYFIKKCGKLIAVTTDQGCLILKED